MSVTEHKSSTTESTTQNKKTESDRKKDKKTKKNVITVLEKPPQSDLRSIKHRNHLRENNVLLTNQGQRI